MLWDLLEEPFCVFFVVGHLRQIRRCSRFFDQVTFNMLY